MNTLNQEFSRFYNQICLSVSQNKTMRSLRQALRRRIGQCFQEKIDLRSPTFLNYGRQATATSIAPTCGEILIEEGILLQHLDKKDIDKWPEPESLHRQVLSAVQTHTPDPPLDRKYSICVRYRGLYKAELFILAKGPDKNLLAINGAEGWRPDPRTELSDWFKNQIEHHGFQLQRIA